MLLYDQLRRVLPKLAQTESDHVVVQQLSEAVVFDIGSLVHSLAVDHDALDVPISKRPPYPQTWIEWGQDNITNDDSVLVRAHCGWLVTWHDAQAIERWESMGYTREKLGYHPETTEICTVLAFVNIRASSLPQVSRGIGFDGLHVLHFADEGRRFLRLQLGIANGDIFGRLAQVNMPHPSRPGECIPIAWPQCPMGAFQLLNCKNVQTQPHRPPAALQRATLKRGHPPLCTSHTLTIALPGETAAGRTGVGEGVGKRLHLVRGHFKNLQHARFVTKGWHWWPPHVRGSAELGVIEKDYALTAQEGP